MKPSTFNPTDPIQEEVVYREQAIGRPPSIADHGRMCRCLKCRSYYNEGLETCAIDECTIEPYPECERHFCFKHCKERCNKVIPW